MPRIRTTGKLKFLLCVCCAALLPGCGTASRSATTTSASTGKSETTTPALATQAHTAPGDKAPAPETAEGRSATAAAATVLAHNYTPNDVSEYHANQPLRVLVGTLTGTSDGYRQKAFFFRGARYLGTDTAQPSATVKVVSQRGNEVTLAYALYRNGHSLENTSGHTDVTFRLKGSGLTHSGWIPPSFSVHGLSRF